MTLLGAAQDAGTGTGVLLVELGLLIVFLAVLARLAHRIGLSPIPGYLLAGLLVGNGGPGPVQLQFSREFVELGAQIGVVLLLLALGLQYTASELRNGLRTGWAPAGFDAAANFTPGVAIGLLLGWDVTTALLLGGVTYISSSGVIAKILEDLGRLGNRETSSILTILVLEDLVMAAYLPLMAVLVSQRALPDAAATLVVALVVVAVVIMVAIRHGVTVSRWIVSPSDEVLLLTVLGVTLVISGVAEQLQVSAAVGAFLVGVAISGPVSKRASQLVGPLRDLFAATFFLFFGMAVDLTALPPVMGIVIALAVITALTKIATGWWVARRAGIGPRGRIRAGTALVARGEFSVVIAAIGVGAGADARLGPITAGYVLLMAFAGPILTRTVGGTIRKK